MSNLWYPQRARDNWTRVRRQAFVQAIHDRLVRGPHELMSWEEVRLRLPMRGSRYRGLRQVPLSQIVGSEGRYTDFDRQFLPRHNHLYHRWQSVDLAHYQAISLPPVELYQIGGVYFVKDGNHRISVARAHGLADIDAYVTEYMVDVPLDEHLSVRELLLREEYSDFLEWTQLHRLRPQQRITLSALGGYLELVGHINSHHVCLAQAHGEDVSQETAIMSWYDNVYMPLVELIRQHGILTQFPGRTEADLYLWIMQHRHTLQQACGADPGPEVAALDYARHYRRRPIWTRVSKVVRSLMRIQTRL